MQHRSCDKTITTISQVEKFPCYNDQDLEDIFVQHMRFIRDRRIQWKHIKNIWIMRGQSGEHLSECIPPKQREKLTRRSGIRPQMLVTTMVRSKKRNI